MVAIRNTERGPTPLFVFPEVYYMPKLDGPIWPVSANIVRLSLAWSNLETLHDPEIAITDRSDYYGWVRYSACIADKTKNLYPTLYDLIWCVFQAFCEPISDVRINEIDKGWLLEFTLYVSRDAAQLRKNELNLKWEEWCSKLFRD